MSVHAAVSAPARLPACRLSAVITQAEHGGDGAVGTHTNNTIITFQTSIPRMPALTLLSSLGTNLGRPAPAEWDRLEVDKGDLPSS